MRFAQREPARHGGTGLNPVSEQAVVIFEGESDSGDPAKDLAAFLKKYAVRVVSMAVWPSSYGHRLVVVFEEEPI